MIKGPRKKKTVISLKHLEKGRKNETIYSKPFSNLREGQVTMKGLSQQATGTGERGVSQAKGYG